MKSEDCGLIVSDIENHLKKFEAEVHAKDLAKRNNSASILEAAFRREAMAKIVTLERQLYDANNLCEQWKGMWEDERSRQRNMALDHGI